MKTQFGSLIEKKNIGTLNSKKMENYGGDMVISSIFSIYFQ